MPGSRKVIAIAGPHHAMPAGSVVLVDIEKGIDGPEPLVRLTPEVRFPESEEPVMRGAPHACEISFDWVSKGCWPGGLLDPKRNTQPTAEEKRWPGESYKTPWPLSEKVFIASFTFDRLFGEPGGNPPNQYGLYICDADGVRELLYRDPRISSMWARPILPRRKPPMINSSFDRKLAAKGVGTYYVSNVYESWPKALPKEEMAKDPFFLGFVPTVLRSRGGVDPLSDKAHIFTAGPDGIDFDADGNLYTGSFGDGRFWRLKNLGGGRYGAPELLDGKTVTCCDGICFDAARNRIILTAAEQNALYAWNIAAGKMELLWANGDNDGATGLFDQPSEVLFLPDGRLVVVNIDAPETGMVNSGPDAVHTLSVIDFK